MIKIRREQFETFERQAHQDFEDELVAHLKQFSPSHAAGVGDDGLRTLIRSGLKSARGYGFQLRGSLRFYVECQVMFGHEFHDDPLTPWAQREFGYRDWADELARADAIHEVATAYRKAVVGENEEIEAAAIERLLARPANEWLDGASGDETTARFIADVYPEKVALASPTAVPALIDRGKRAAEANALPTAAGGRLVTALMIAFGHGVLTDPQFPWIAGNLNDTAGRPQERRVEALAVRALAYLSDGLASMKQG
jgi:hypothetical protein